MFFFRKYFFAGIILFFAVSNCIGQNAAMDSVQRLLQTNLHDTVKLNLYLWLCEKCDVKDNKKYAEPALELASKLIGSASDRKLKLKLSKQKAYAYDVLYVYYNFKGDTARIIATLKNKLFTYKAVDDTIGVVTMLVKLGEHYNRVGLKPIALDYYKQARNEAAQKKSPKSTAVALLGLAQFYSEGEQADYAQAENLILDALSIHKRHKDTARTNGDFVALASLYSKMHLVDKSKVYYQKVLVYHDARNDSLSQLRLLNNIGWMYFENKMNDSALNYFEKSLSISEAKKSYSFVRGVSGNISFIYSERRDYENAFIYVRKGMEAALKTGDSMQVAWGVSRFAAFYYNTKKYALARKFSDRFLGLLKKYNNEVEQSRDGELLAYRIDSASGNHSGAFSHYYTYVQLQNQLNNKEVIKAASRERLEAQYDKQKLVERSEQEKKDILSRDELQKQKIVRNSFVSGFILMLLLAIVIFKNYRQKKKAHIELEKKNEVIAEKNRDITDSINYALRIQQAKLPERSEFSNLLPQSFVLFKPKDIVSGDFYFIQEKADGVFVACADCTGHGVPGAFMSLIGYERLDDAVQRSVNPSEALAILNRGVKSSLKQSSEKESTRDGMDIALCKIDLRSGIVIYAGANRPIWIIRKGSSEVEEIKATKKAIAGFTEDEQHFEEHVIQLSKGDTFYIFSDGYADCFSGTNGKKLTTKKFREVILGMQIQSMQQQENILDNFIEDWKSGIEQVDDILVIGIRV